MKVGEKIKVGERNWEISGVYLAAVDGQSVVGLKVERPTFGPGGTPVDEMLVPAEIIEYLTAPTQSGADKVSRDTKEEAEDTLAKPRCFGYHDNTEKACAACVFVRGCAWQRTITALYESTLEPKRPVMFGCDVGKEGGDQSAFCRILYDWSTGKLRMEKIEKQERKALEAADVLRSAAEHMEDRRRLYDKPEGERSMPPTVAAFNAITGHELTEEQGWLFMELLKAVRAEHNGYRPDNYEDGVAYCALKGEAAARNRGESST